MALVLGVDSSTQSTKVEMRDADTGELVGSGRAAHPATFPPRSEQDPESWREALVEARRRAGSQAVVAMAIAAQQHGLVALDDRAEVIRPAKLWNDTESADDAQWLVEQLGGPEPWVEACGSVPVASFTISKLSWLHRCEPENFDRLARVLLPHDWLTFRMSGRFTTDRGDASGTGYWSPSRRSLAPRPPRGRRRHEGLGRAACPRCSAPPSRCVSASGAMIAPGTGDNMAAALGVALRARAGRDLASAPRAPCTRSATRRSPTRRATSPGSPTPPAGTCRWCARSTAMRVIDTFARLLRVDLTDFDELALAGEPGAGGLVLLPYLDGERTPNLPDASGTIAGLRSDVTPEQVARAAVEGVVCGLLDALEALRVGGVNVRPADGTLLLGGGARLRSVQRVLADLTRCSIVVPHGEPVATGACVQAAAVLQQTPPRRRRRGVGPRRRAPPSNRI